MTNLLDEDGPTGRHSWMESRRLVASLLRTLAADVKDLREECEKYHESSRVSHSELDKRLALLNQKVQMTSAIAAVITSAIVTSLVNIVVPHLMK